jgi:hypothetical protein
MASTVATEWHLKGRGYEFCNCDFGCGCNFGGFPNSKDGSCRAFVGYAVESGRCGDVDLTGVPCGLILAWPGAIHDGRGEGVLIVDTVTTDKQAGALGQIFSGALGGLPWELLGSTLTLKGIVKAPITIEGEGVRSVFRVEGIGEGRGEALKNPVTGEDHFVNVDLPNGFIWQHGECGRGTHRASAEGVSVAADGSNWIFYTFDWSNG